MMSLGDFRPIFLYEFKLNQSAAETVRKINQEFGNDSVNKRTVRCWFAKFRSGDFSLEDEPRNGRLRVIQDGKLISITPFSAYFLSNSLTFRYQLVLYP